jgi:hypothetical protein
MTYEQINKAIAKACGWKYKPVNCGGANYCADLNAMHEAEQAQWRKSYSSRYDFVYELGKILMPTIGYRAEAVDLLDATARQRAEAFLKAIGKWEE